MANYPPAYYPQPYQQGAYYQQQSYQQPMIAGRMVTSKEEAMSVPADFVNRITLCPDMGHGVIYAKIFDPETGTAPLVEFRRTDTKTETESRMDAIERQLKEILQKLDEPAKGKHVKEATE